MHFQYFKSELNFLENSNLFKKLDYRFLVESTKISKITFPYKTAMPEANFKRNRMEITKCTHHKEGSFDRYYFIFSKILFQFKNFI